MHLHQQLIVATYFKCIISRLTNVDIEVIHTCRWMSSHIMKCTAVVDVKKCCVRLTMDLQSRKSGKFWNYNLLSDSRLFCIIWNAYLSIYDKRCHSQIDDEFALYKNVIHDIKNCIIRLTIGSHNMKLIFFGKDKKSFVRLTMDLHSTYLKLASTVRLAMV